MNILFVRLLTRKGALLVKWLISFTQLSRIIPSYNVTANQQNCSSRKYMIGLSAGIYLLFEKKENTGCCWWGQLACLFALHQLYLPQQTVNPQIGTISEKAKL